MYGFIHRVQRITLFNGINDDGKSLDTLAELR